MVIICKFVLVVAQISVTVSPIAVFANVLRLKFTRARHSLLMHARSLVSHGQTLDRESLGNHHTEMPTKRNRTPVSKPAGLHNLSSWTQMPRDYVYLVTLYPICHRLLFFFLVTLHWASPCFVITRTFPTCRYSLGRKSWCICLFTWLSFKSVERPYMCVRYIALNPFVTVSERVRVAWCFRNNDPKQFLL